MRRQHLDGRDSGNNTQSNTQEQLSRDGLGSIAQGNTVERASLRHTREHASFCSDFFVAEQTKENTHELSLSSPCLFSLALPSDWSRFSVVCSATASGLHGARHGCTQFANNSLMQISRRIESSHVQLRRWLPCLGCNAIGFFCIYFS